LKSQKGLDQNKKEEKKETPVNKEVLTP